MFFKGWAREPLENAPGTIQTHTDLYGSIRTHMDTSQVNFHILDKFENVCKKVYKVQTHIFFDNQRCSYFDSVQEALIIKFQAPFLMILWMPFFHDFGGHVDDDTHLDIPLPPYHHAGGKNTS